MNITYLDLNNKSHTLYNVQKVFNPTTRSIILVHYVGSDGYQHSCLMSPGGKFFVQNLTDNDVELTDRNTSMWIEQLNNWMAIDKL